MTIKIVKQQLSKNELETIAQEIFGFMVKAAVDIEKKLLALGGEWHSQCQEALIENGSFSGDIWGINILCDAPKEKRIEYISLINIKPNFGHRKMEVENPEIKEKIEQIINELVE